MQTDPLFEEIYNPQIMASLERQFGPVEVHRQRLHVTTGAMQRQLTKMAAGEYPRRGEVVMVVPDEAGRVWLHTKQQYPAGVYRLMSGGVNPQESPVAALKRETLEETGFNVEAERCLGVLLYQLSGTDCPSMSFVSYMFLTTATTGRPHPTDPGEAISDFKAVEPAKLAEVGQHLRSIEGDFNDWGKFRATAHDIAAARLA
jgi:ADP-ribose pyrophosphatase YjhB (NUDIX family)